MGSLILILGGDKISRRLKLVFILSICIALLGSSAVFATEDNATIGSEDLSTDSIASTEVTTVTESSTNSYVEESIDTEETSKSGLEYKNENDNSKETKSRTDDVDNKKATKDVANNQVIDASKEVQTFVQNNHELPNDISVNGKQVTMNEFLYLVSQTLINVNKEDYTGVDYLELPDQSINMNIKVSGTLTKNQYLSLCASIVDFIKTNNAVPDTRGSSLGIIQFKSMVYHLATALNIYSTVGQLPDSLNFDDSVFEKPTNAFSAAGETPIIFTSAQITAASKKIVNYVKKNKKLPNSVTIGKTKVNMAEYLYLVSKLVSNLNKGSTKSITYVKLSAVTNITTKSINKKFSKAKYLAVVNKILSYIKTNKKVPISIKTKAGTLDFRVLVYDLSKVVKSYNTNHVLPNSIKVTNTVFKKKKTTKSFTLAQIGKAGKTVKKYVEKHEKLPKTVTIGKTKVNMAEYLYLASKLAINVHKHKNGSISYRSISKISNVTIKSINKKISKSAYISVANKILSYIKSNNNVPLSIKTKVGTVDFNVLTYNFAKIANSYKTKHKLPSYVKLSSSKFKDASPKSNTDSLTLSEIYDAATQFSKIVDEDGILPDKITINKKKLIMADLLDIFAKTLIKLNNKENITDIEVRKLNYTNFSSSNSVSGDIKKEDYLKLAKDIENYISAKNKAPNLLDTSLGKIQFRTMLYTLSKAINSYENKSKLPSSVSVSDSVFVDASKKKYLVATKNCQVKNKKIKNLAKSLVSGLKSNWDKAKKIFNYVRNKVTYSFYFNTKRGALKTLSSKRGNCVDMAHLVVALSRAAKLPARYVHADCTFRSGRRIGHVWAEIYIDGKWVKADATSNYNTLGKIVNWHNGAYHGRHISLPF